MSDPAFAAILTQLREFRESRDWQRFHTPANLAAAIASEAGELLHLYRWTPPADDPPLDRVEDELADLLIFALNFSDVLGIDIEEAVLRKLERNRARFPISTIAQQR